MISVNREVPSNLKAMILAAGRGTRLRPLTNRLPKCMLPVSGKPLLEHTVEWLVSSGVKDIIINVSHLGEVIMDHFGDGQRWNANIVYSIEDEPLGTAGGVKKASWFFDENPFIVWYGDNLSRCNLELLLAFHFERGGLATIGLHYREDVSQSGIVLLNETGRIRRFVEKPRTDKVFSDWVNAGIYVLEPSVIEDIPEQGTPDFGHDIFPRMLSEGRSIFGYKLSAREGLTWYDRPEDVERFNQGG